jgi:GT2 family glycosyltransferase
MSVHSIGDVRHVAGATEPPAGGYDADIVILAMDRPDETLAAIASALAQAGVSRHVTVVDQGSRSEHLARFAAIARGRTDCTVLRTDRNRGVAGGRNRASAFGHGRVIVALDNDAEFATPRTVADAVAAFDAAPHVGAIGFRILAHATGGDDHSSWGYPPRLRRRAGEIFDATTFVGAGHAIRRTAWKAGGGYDEALFFCWEEFDFCLRAIALGWTVRYRGDLAVLHKVSQQGRVAWSSTRWYYYVRNRVYIEHKWGGGWRALLPRILGYGLRGLRNGLPRQTWQGVYSGLRLGHRVAHPAALPPVALAYLARTDTAHRGSLLSRVRDEVLPALSAAPFQARWASLSRSSSPNIGGSSIR